MDLSARKDERRDPNDRRWESERRRGERRQTPPPPEIDTRADDRRLAGRRSDDRRSDERRCIAFPPFPTKSASTILDTLHRTGAPPTCPVCNASLVLGPVVTFENKPSREIHCPTCRTGVLAEGIF